MKKLTREEIEKAVEAWLCQLANVSNPDYAVDSMKSLIYGSNPPDLSPIKLIALGKTEALFSVLKMFTQNH